MNTLDELSRANLEFERRYSRDSGKRQPIHTVYGGAHLFKADTCPKFGKLAERALTEYAGSSATFGTVIGVPEQFAEIVYGRILDKLRREPVEDYRIDFEDGYGIRSDVEEDAAADAAISELASALEQGSLPPFFGIRIKPLNEELKNRSLRTLRRFLDSAKQLPEHFVVTLPKITVPEQVSALTAALAPYPNVKIEIMVETPQALIMLPRIVDAAEGRCIAAHFGPYDYTSTLGITAANQHLLHPSANFARSMMQVFLAGRGLWLADGPTNTMPIGIHRGDSLTEAQRTENRESVHHAWKLHYRHVREALHNGFYQGWDLHPAQLPTRYAAVYSFFLEGLNSASERLRNFVAKAAQATTVGHIFDDAATAQGLLNYFRRALACGAIAESEIPALTGLTVKQLHSGSFAHLAEANSL